MIKTKMFTDLINGIDPSVQINRWLDKHPDYIIVDVKFQSSVVGADDSVNYSVFRDALVIYREYENV
ncbi:sporulation protein Cse60 [Limosilactobacillus mucosae]|uniref:Sporulation protein Cse60 n=1 Tax=Limosilactobacillus mucosae TaxID=97478 RepID=A0AAJ1HT74_LIMMU|nr:sporulation protein Cse60 [Limosilactobacillus mucosae]MDC2830047.1 sporulation protein Cse60 [Limosilactobacillus mucosae]MDC2837504.1 sporulation protein Cse60 [Limosilactobacillus mucosae]MDC2853771.1 sporulation protein Cse60 [Limosilactobacillus mucosae]